MPQTYTQLYYHVVWATRGREPVLSAAMVDMIAAAIRNKSVELRAMVLAVNGMPDHLHLAVRLPASLSVAKYVEEIKGYASYRVNHSPDLGSVLRWQEGYGAMTFRKNDVPVVVRYIQRQQEHHRQQELWPEWEHVGAEGK